MIVLVGVAHVIDVSQQIGQLVSYYSPGAVGVELDPSRYQALRDGERPSNVPLAYRLLSLMQRRLAEQFGGEVGAVLSAGCLFASRTAIVTEAAMTTTDKRARITKVSLPFVR